MKANELRIGNYLRKNGIIVKIDARSIFDIWNETKIYEPIPITEEWLAKLGIKPNDSLYPKYNIGVLTIYRPVLSHRMYVIIQASGSIISLNHVNNVHELQNLYFALTGEELTLSE